LACLSRNLLRTFQKKGAGETTMGKIRVLLADSYTLFRKGLRQIIAEQSDMTVVGEASDGIEAVHKTQELAPDIVLMEIEMPGLDGIGAAQMIREQARGVGIIVLTIHLEDEYVLAAVKAGAQGYISKRADPEQVLEAIRAVHSGEVRIDPAIASKVLTKLCREGEASQEHLLSLTRREEDILSCVVKGATNREIGEELLLSERTVRNRLSGIFKKLGVRNRTEAALYAVQEGLLP